ncbi:CaiB/BaiF CoA transferase family protein [Stutzerimonas azotifigens]|uniref:CaiB/BaiF CoA transferase family protein n=1 Tax=Stutzerimonas azotifigens TaxID=291995 RepID=UPI0004270C83|nr:CoA transferase [Stutzerimonas azotifigens]
MLSGKTVLDLSWILGGPFGGQLLAQLGAEVIKIEPIGGDFARTVPPVSDDEDSAFFLSVNRGKKSIALDLKHPDGREAFYDLVRRADAVIYGFAPDVPGRLKIDYASLAAINPRISVAQLIGLDDKGKYAKAPAFDLVVQAMSGLMSINGEENGRPTRVGYQVADLAGGLYLALGALAAMLKAETTGQGEHVQVSLLDCQIAMLTWQAQGYLSFGTVPRAMGSRHAMIAPSEAYPAGDGRYIAISPTGESFWRKFCEAIGRPDLPDDQRFGTATERMKNVDALAEEITETLRTKTAREWEAILMEARVPAAVVNRVDEALATPVVRERGMVEEVVRPADGKATALIGSPFKFRDAPILAYPPALAADTATVLMQRCGYSHERIEALASVGAIQLAAE